MEEYKTNTVESTANYEGNDSMLLFQRLENPKIRNQVIDLLLLNEESKIGSIIHVTYFDKNNVLISRPENENILYTPLSREQIEVEYDRILHEMKGRTDIKFAEWDFETSTNVCMVLGAKAPWNEKTYTIKQMSITESHEKGHLIRRYSSKFFKKYFSKACKLEVSELDQDIIDMWKKALPKNEREKAEDEVKREVIEYLLSPTEIVERMAQLKNYFGMSGGEEFTSAHLEYARINYVRDTDLDNSMKYFFKSIKPETEEEFLRLINNAGV